MLEEKKLTADISNPAPLYPHKAQTLIVKDVFGRTRYQGHIKTASNVGGYTAICDTQEQADEEVKKILERIQNGNRK